MIARRFISGEQTLIVWSKTELSPEEILAVEAAIKEEMTIQNGDLQLIFQVPIWLGYGSLSRMPASRPEFLYNRFSEQ